MLTLHAETDAEKRELARRLVVSAPAVLDDLKVLGVLFGPFERIDLEVDDESKAGRDDVPD